MTRHKGTCAIRNERMYMLNEEQKNIRQEERENEKKGELIKCKFCNDCKSKRNISRHRRTCKCRDGKLDGVFPKGMKANR